MAIYNEISNYPNDVDDLIFYSDIDLKHSDIANRYKNSISFKRYYQLKEMLESDDAKGLHGNFASLYNMLENRIYNLQEHAKTKTKREMIFYETTPTDNQIQYGVIEIQ